MSLPATTRPPVDAGRRRFGLFEFDLRAGELSRDGRVVKLSPQPARVLALLLARPGEIVLREELRDHLWGSDTFVDFERGLNFCILQVRGALSDSSENPRFVQTVPRKGYRFIAPVTTVPATPAVPVEDATPGPITPAGPVPLPITAVPAGAWRRPALVGAAVLAAAAMVWALLALRPFGAPAPAGGRIRLAVLPIVNLTGNPADDMLADGLTDELISELGQLSPRRLAVIARTSAMSYRKNPKSVADIGRELNVTYLVESSVRRDGGALRINTNLITVADQTPSAAWSETFGTSEPGGAASQAHAAIRMARLVALKLLPDEDAESSARAPASLAAWETFLSGRALMNRGTPADVRQAITAFESVVRDDPAFAPAWAKIAEARHLLVMMGAMAPLDAYPAARDAASRALAADAGTTDAHLAQGLVQLWFDWKPVDAAASFERALALNDSSSAAHHDYAWALMAAGRDEDAIQHVRTARDLDPLSARATNDIGWLYLHLRRPADAERACRQTLALHPGSLEAQSCLERAYTQRGLWEAAVQAARATMPAEAYQQLTAGRTAEATMQALWRWRLERLESAARTRWISPYTLAVQHLLVGNAARAIEELERARDQKVGMLVFLARDPAVDSLRGDPRFARLTAR